MAFDDIVRVADLKSRTARWARVRGEVKATRDDDRVTVYDHFKPGVPEFAALLPRGSRAALIAWDKRRQANGAQPLGAAAQGGGAQRGRHSLCCVRWRHCAGCGAGTRYREEQAMIERWLDRIEHGPRADWALGHEIALCGRLIKGYGATNERGKGNLLHVLDHLVNASGTAAQRARAIALARAAALADDAGQALDKQMVELGAPPRRLKPQTIVWAKSRVRPVENKAKDMEGTQG